MSKITEFINKQKSRSDIEKDIHNPFRRVVRHTIFKNKYGSMMDYHASACSYYCNQPMIDIDQVVAESREKMKQHLEERDKKLEEKEAKKAAKKAKKDLTDEVAKMIEEDTEALQNIVNELHEIINKEEESSKENAVTEDLINNNPNITKGEDGLYHFTPVFFHDEDSKKDEKTEPVKEEPKAEIEDPVKEETSNIKPKKEPKVPQDRKKSASKNFTKKVMK